MATSPRTAPGSLPSDSNAGGRLHIHGIKEMPAGYDAEVAELFRDLRAASGLTEADLAAQLATRPEVVQALEQGALFALPPWPETYRVVVTYGNLLNLDVRPLLRRIYAQVEAGIVELAPKSMPDVPFMAPPDGIDREPQRQPQPAAPEAAPMRPRQAAQPSPRGPQPAPDQRGQPRQAPPQSGQQEAPWQPQEQSPLPPPQWSQPRPLPPQPSSRLAPPLQQPRGAPPPPRAPQPKPQTNAVKQARPPAVPQTAAPPLPKSPRKAWPIMALVKWGLPVLIVLGVVFGLWKWLAGPALLGSGPASTPGASSSGGPLDPNDPRSRKADRLPGPS
jgi:hypothetical protein